MAIEKRTGSIQRPDFSMVWLGSALRVSVPNGSFKTCFCLKELARRASEGFTVRICLQQDLSTANLLRTPLQFLNHLVTNQTLRIRNGMFRSVPELEQAIRDDIAHHNTHSKNFVWAKKAEDILAKVTRARSALNKISSE